MSEATGGDQATGTQGVLGNNGGLYMAVREGFPEEVTREL